MKNGIYLHGGGETIPLATEGGGGDSLLLWEAVAENELVCNRDWDLESASEFVEVMRND